MSAIISLNRPGNTIPSASPAIVIFPHAGGSPRFYGHWAQVLSAYALWGITYPGRDARLGEQPAATLQTLAGECARRLDFVLEVNSPALLVGHSMGAWVAWETARLLEKMTPARQIMTVVSGQNPPDSPPGTTLHLQDDATLIADMNRQNPAHSALWENADMRELFMPAVRDDYRLLETYQAMPGSVSDLTVVYGEDDPEIDRRSIAHWRRAGHGAWRIQSFPGGHFYLAAPNISLPLFLKELLPW